MVEQRLTAAELANALGDLILRQAKPGSPYDTACRAIRELLHVRIELDRCRASMLRAMNALEPDTELSARRQAFALIQRRFDDVSPEDRDCAQGLIGTLIAALGGEQPKH